MKLIRLSSIGICAAALAFLATTSTPRHGKSAAKPGDRLMAATQPANAEDWKKVGQWLKDNQCEQRYQFVNKQPMSEVRREQAKKLIIQRVYQIQQIRDPDRKKAAIELLQAQDQIFAAQIAYRLNPSPQGVEVMRKAVSNLIDAQIAERQIQLNRLQAEVKDVGERINELKSKKQPEHLDTLARGFLDQVQSRPRQLRSSDELGGDGNSGSTNADVKR